jgi:CubicO group peptidase (beta-lactamase class C family)
MTDKADKAAAAKVEDKQDAAYEKYEREQADHEKKHPGEIDEPAYAKYEAAYDKAEVAKPLGATSTDGTDRAEQQKKYDAAHAEAVKLSAVAAEAHAKAEKKVKTPEQVAAEEADKKADDAHAKAAALHPDANPPAGAPAGNIGGRPVKLNVPGHPAYADGIPTDDESQTVSLFHTSEDGTSRVYTRVHPDMVGDYLRGGWSRA